MNILIEVDKYVRENIANFHEARLNKLKTLKLGSLLKRKNPYLYRAKDLNTPQEIVEALTSAFLSSAEESIFGDWLEQLAIYVASKAFNGHKSTTEGIDLEMDVDGVHYIVSVKSGPNWGNASQKRKLLDDFAKAKRIYRTGRNRLPCEAVEGCCYGRDRRPQKISHAKLCGERFWTFISGEERLYKDIIGPLGNEAKKHNEIYLLEYSKMITRFTKDFAIEFSDEEGSIDWDKIVELNSGI